MMIQTDIMWLQSMIRSFCMQLTDPSLRMMLPACWHWVGSRNLVPQMMNLKHMMLTKAGSLSPKKVVDNWVNHAIMPT